MSKTFKTITASGRTLKVDGLKGRSVYLEISGESESRRNINLDASDAPALALAILEAANHDMGSEVSLAVEYLERYVEAVAEKEDEDKERAELEAEALELRHAWNGVQLEKLGDLTERSQEKWLAVARKAREMRNEKKQ